MMIISNSPPVPARMTLLLVALAIGSTRGQDRPAAAPALATIALPAPELDKGVPVMRALKDRKSTRELADRPLSRQQLSELLWAADGVNREGGHRTAPSALARYPVDIYVVLVEGVYRYNPSKHQLDPVAAGDHRAQAGEQAWERNAPVNLVYVADLARFDDAPGSATIGHDDRMKWSAIEAGCQAQSVYLYCASEGLGATVRASATTEAFGKAVPLRSSQVVLCGQTIGLPASK
jgi:nitroreductase